MNLRDPSPLPLHQSTRRGVNESLRALQAPLRFLKGVGPKRAEQLEKFGLRSVEDLLYHFPFRYEDRREIKKIRDAELGRDETFVGRLSSLQKKYIPRRRSQMLAAALNDGTGSLGLVWYRAPAYLINGLSTGQTILAHGKVEQAPGGLKRLVHPEFDILDAGSEIQLEKIQPIYLRPGGLPLSRIRRWVEEALLAYGECLPQGLPVAVLQRQRLIDLRQAVVQLHRPANDADVASLNNFVSVAHRSVIFDELFCLQLGMGLKKKNRIERPGVVLPHQPSRLSFRMRELLPFSLTRAQERVVEEIRQDMESSRPMRRLVQGDVGSGKTVVAWLASLPVIESGHQAVWLAPTELLAEQHYRICGRWAESLGLRTALLTASVSSKEKKSLLERIARNDIQFVVGTHALLQEGVKVPRMGLGVIDEQHRFGVIQRLSLQRLVGGEKGSPFSARSPHMLLMSATPIPRSLAMVLYGDMEVSFLDEMPPGRAPVVTRMISEAGRPRLYSRVVEELKRGHQAFIVYPLVEASEQLQQIRDATRMAEQLSKGIFREFQVGLVHGRMRTQERDRVMRSFRDGQVRILVATTVVEVGIDIPNATVMIVEHAERFGLSQLHQLRGRVGRGDAPGYCLLVHYGSPGGDAIRRLKVMEREHDGFKIAEADLELRGAGELLGTRQSGLGDFRIANLARDSRILLDARREALEWLKRDPDLKSRESAGLREILEQRWGRRLQLGAVG
ncbi:MAG TPA: ATP-dependent DNA helicase RecG [Candidatus Binatia bacterium]|nr:ATP-dependent DNA helicase RecG [Candidatus Binatia bacterium]